jgi:succinate-semialdehyde dehydrogenase/glutarate-semialdehyde dehydrogenase
MIDFALIPGPKGFVAGRWVDADSRERYRVTNPANGEQLAEAPLMGEVECTRAVEAAKAAMQSATSLDERRHWLQGIGDRLLEHKEELAKIITLEHGKPLREGTAEVDYSASFFHFFATQLEKLSSHELPQVIRGCRWRVDLRPAGVVGAIASWNFPLAMICKKLAPALGAGCGVVVKPASLTPLSAMALGGIAETAGLPPGMFNLVIGKSQPIGQVLCSHPAVRVISFTGSTEVGKELAAAAAPRLKRLTLELGGNAPFIVFEDADLLAAVDSLIANKFRSGGQTCVCANRVFVHQTVADDFLSATAERTRRLKVGNGEDPEVDIGPLINRDGFDKVAAHVRDALAKGANRLVGADPPRPEEDWGCFYPATLLAAVRPEMRVCREETFGPVIAVSVFDDEASLVELANGTEYGLAAYVFTNDSERAERLASVLQFGHLGLNTGTGPTAEAPFGGVKDSGFGREGGLEGLLEFCEPQTVVHG